MLRKIIVLVVLAVLLLLAAMAQQKATVYVTLWFDTEDYTSPEPDTIILPLCRILEKRGIRATFKLIGEKARDLERKGQKDVIEALARHDIGFHTTYHSQPPAVSAYLDRLDWDDGVQEFLRREDSGFRDTKRIFRRVPICYGQPGNSWAPQVFVSLRRWGIPLYLDEGTHVGLKGKPFYYCGLLNVYDMAEQSTRMGLEGAADYEKGVAAFRKIHEKLAQQGGGLVSIYYHPNEFDHTEFWDAAIWARGANPPRERWTTAGKRTPESRRQALEYFDRYLDLMQKMPGVRFVSASDLVQLYADRSAGRAFARGEIQGIASALTREISFQSVGKDYLSAAEAFSVLLRWYLRNASVNAVRAMTGILGPARREPGQSVGRFQKWEFRRACEEALDVMERRGRVPEIVWIGSVPVAPADFLATLASEILQESPEIALSLTRGVFTAEKYAAEDSESVFDWVIHPAGFHAPHVMDLAKLQCWTLKPAVAH